MSGSAIKITGGQEEPDVRVRSAGQKYGRTCHQRDRADVTEFVTLVRLSSLGQHVGVLALAGYKRRKSALTMDPIVAFLTGSAVTLMLQRYDLVTKFLWPPATGKRAITMVLNILVDFINLVMSRVFLVVTTFGLQCNKSYRKCNNKL